MTGIFGPEHSAVYDAIYREKDYPHECDVIERVLRAHGRRETRTILDLGCGTGSHAIALAERGYAVTGVDLSAGMLAVARAKASATLPSVRAGSVSFELGDVRSTRLGARYDAIVMMFAVLGYQTSDEALTATLNTVRDHLEPGGVFLFDVWFRPAVLRIGPSARTKTVAVGERELRRTVTAELDRAARLCAIDIVLEQNQGGRAPTITRETHAMRYFDEEELVERSRSAGLDWVGLTAFPQEQAPATDATWNVLGVARKRESSEAR